MSEAKDKKEKPVEGTKETGKKEPREPDQVIEIRNVYSTETSKKEDPTKDVTSPKAKEKSAKTGEKVGEEVATETGKKEKVETPQLSRKELQDQLAAEKKKREGLELIVEAEATKQFESEKTEFLELIKDEDRRKELGEKIGDDPTVLNEYKRITSFFTSALEEAGIKVTGKPETKKAGEEDVKEPPTGTDADKKTDAGAVKEKPEKDKEGKEGEDDDKPAEKSLAGRATLPPDQGAGADTYKAYVDELYEILKNPEKTVKERKFADDQINKLFASMLLGIKSSDATKRGNMPYLPAIATCPNCQGQLVGDLEKCPSCGWKLYAKNFTPRGR